MLENLYYYFVPAAILIMIIAVLFFVIEKRKIIKNYRQVDSKELKNVTGLMISSGKGLSKKWQLCHFDLLINQNSIFIFPRSFYIYPVPKINLIFSNSDRRNTKSPDMLRELIIKNKSVDLVYYPSFLIGSRIIRLQNLLQEQILIFEDIEQRKNY